MRFEDMFVDPYSGHEHSKTKDSLIGPGASYLFRNESRHTAYIGVSLLKWTRTETPILVSAPGMTASRWDPYFGGGYRGGSPATAFITQAYFWHRPRR